MFWEEFYLTHLQNLWYPFRESAMDWAGLYPLWYRGSTTFDRDIINQYKLLIKLIRQLGHLIIEIYSSYSVSYSWSTL